MHELTALSMLQKYVRRCKQTTTTLEALPNFMFALFIYISRFTMMAAFIRLADTILHISDGIKVIGLRVG
ncbi:hypothetical protein [Pseudoduganella lutea]|uniref:Uncharacterized protein n=1 Tax=Pseudoduganella lutea TaxID=321985 RepID=A0A4V0Z302_9BURK|nr:hypothetical protein [Pseudoduganella lutea]QBE61733.1 hypothetical protein EWM63_00905 [Pseudoduganella lutea]